MIKRDESIKGIVERKKPFDIYNINQKTMIINIKENYNKKKFKQMILNLFIDKYDKNKINTTFNSWTDIVKMYNKKKNDKYLICYNFDLMLQRVNPIQKIEDLSNTNLIIDIIGNRLFTDMDWSKQSDQIKSRIRIAADEFEILFKSIYNENKINKSLLNIKLHEKQHKKTMNKCNMSILNKSLLNESRYRLLTNLLKTNIDYQILKKFKTNYPKIESLKVIEKSTSNKVIISILKRKSYAKYIQYLVYGLDIDNKPTHLVCSIYLDKVININESMDKILQ